MNKRKQKEFLEERWKMLHQHFDQFCQHQNPVDIHQMRVFTKKIHSFVKLYSHTFPGRDLAGIFKPVRKIFKNAGIIREAQIHLLNFEKIGLANKKLENRLKNLIQKETQKFVLREKKYRNLLHKAEKDFYNELSLISDSQVKSFYRDFIHVPQLIFNRKKYIPHLHDSRKNLKSILHITELTGKRIGKKKELDIEYLNELTEKIGIWHDLHQTQLWLKGKKIDPNSQKSLDQNIEDILFQIDTSKESFKEKILLVSSTEPQIEQKQ